MTRILFVCRANIGRSQAASSLYNLYFPGSAESAGTKIYKPVLSLGNIKIAKNIIKVMAEFGIDISSNVPRQVNKRLLSSFDKIVVMAEPATIPHWLLSHPAFEYWSIEDAKDKNINETRAIVRGLENRIKNLVKHDQAKLHKFRFNIFLPVKSMNRFLFNYRKYIKTRIM